MDLSKYQNSYDNVHVVICPNIYDKYSVWECSSKNHTEENGIGKSIKK